MAGGFQLALAAARRVRDVWEEARIHRQNPLLAVASLLRHSNINVTARVYAHRNADEYRAAANVLDEPPKLRS